MKASLSRQLPFRLGPLPFPGWRRPLLPLLVALVLNGLLVLPALRPTTRTSSVAAAGARDDTPELLRFSRRQAQEPAMGILPLPSQSALPPPPPVDLAAPRPRGAPRRARTTTARTAPASAAGAAQDRQVAGIEAQGSAARMLALALNLRALEGADAEAIQGLWDQATAAREPPPGMPALPEDGELRQLPLARAQATGLPLKAPEAVLTGNRVLLLWPEALTLWMVRLGTP